MKKIRTTIVIVIVFVVVGLTGGFFLADGASKRSAPLASSGQWQLLRTTEGTLIYDAFTEDIPSRQVQDVYEFNGDIDPSRAFVRATAGGLQVGVDTYSLSATFSGYFAVTHDAYPETSIFHVRMSKQAGQIESPDKVGEAVFAVQTASTKITGVINFIVISSVSTAGTTSWKVGYMYGQVQDANYIVYWGTKPSPEAPDTQDITLRTDGRHTLAVWFGDELVFHSNELQLDIQAPFQPYLEVQAMQTPYMSSFQDFWVVKDDRVRVTGAPARSRVALVANGIVLSERTAGAGGEATLILPPYAAKGSATLEITEPGHQPVRLGSFDYAGGDELQLVQK